MMHTTSNHTAFMLILSVLLVGCGKTPQERANELYVAAQKAEANTEWASAYGKYEEIVDKYSATDTAVMLMREKTLDKLRPFAEFDKKARAAGLNVAGFVRKLLHDAREAEARRDWDAAIAAYKAVVDGGVAVDSGTRGESEQRLARIGPIAAFVRRVRASGKEVGDALGMKFVKILPGEFLMGSNEQSGDGPMHKVRITKPFEMSAYEVTQGQWAGVMGTKPWAGEAKENILHPARYISWNDCQKFIARLNACGPTAYRLPTEAEWEYACRAGSTTKYCFGDSQRQLGEYAWWYHNSGRSTHPVGQKKANDWGIHDMHGNVWEWCSSKPQPYPYKADDGREDLSDTASSRVLRGGSCNDNSLYDPYNLAHGCRSPTRRSVRPSSCSNGHIGFRLVVSARAPSEVSQPEPKPAQAEDERKAAEAEQKAEAERRAAQAKTSTAGKSSTNSKDGSEMIYVPAGTFKMGSDDGDSYEKPVHDVRVEAFHISKCEITNKQFKKFVDANPEWRKDRISKEYHDGAYLEHWEGDTYPSDKADDPVVYVSWFAAKAYCEWASSGGLRGRLPTEAEWEYACRAGSTGKYCFGDDESKLGDYAWYDKNSGNSTHPVGDKKPNAWGIHDMHGNVWEWTSSTKRDYPYKANDGREDLSDTASCRVVRGGGWHGGSAHSCNSAGRCLLSVPPSGCDDLLGFRVVFCARAPG